MLDLTYSDCGHILSMLALPVRLRNDICDSAQQQIAKPNRLKLADREAYMCRHIVRELAHRICAKLII